MVRIVLDTLTVLNPFLTAVILLDELEKAHKVSVSSTLPIPNPQHLFRMLQ
jgi:hypothetical protein